MTAVAVQTTCGLCGLRCGANSPRRTFSAQDLVFCCLGCANVYTILLESGMVRDGVDLRETELYRRGLALGLLAVGEAEPAAPATPLAGEATELCLHLSGMWCASCAWLIEHALRRESGVVDAQVSFASDAATVRYDPMRTAPSRIRTRIESLGYTARDGAAGDGPAQAESRSALVRLGIAAFLWFNVMSLNMTVYVGYFERLPAALAARLPLVLLVLSTPAVFYGAWPILRLAWKGLAARVIRTETLLAAGILCAWGYSAVEALRGGAHVYFDTACAIVVLVLLGKWIERGAKDKARRAVTRLYSLIPTKVRLWNGGEERFVAIEALKPGDVFVVKVGERFPADGVVVNGESQADESMLTGESALVGKSPGEVVVSGSANTTGVLYVRATHVGEASTVARIVALVERAFARRSAVEHTADRVTRVFVPVVAFLALATFVLWRWPGGAGTETAILRAISVLVIACPCALGIAAPLAITAAVGAASRRGILVRDSSVLETVERVDVLVLDKTGTVTEPGVVLHEVNDAHLPMLAALESFSEHPVGLAVVARARELRMPLSAATAVTVHPGAGIRGQVGTHDVWIGTRRFLAEMPAAGGAASPSAAAAAREFEIRASELEAAGMTVAHYGWDGQVQGLLAQGARIRDGAAEMLRAVQAHGVQVCVLSGDSRRATEWAARAIGAAEFHAEALPEDKAAFVQRLRSEGRIVAMVGDGVNDAPALAAAQLGIAMGSGADVAMNAAAVTLTCNALPRIIDVFRLSRRTLRIVRQNLFWAFAYNTAGISLAVAGRLHPIAAAAAMVVSSVCVVANSARLLGGKPDAR